MISEMKEDILSILINRFTLYVYLLRSTRVVGHEFQHDGEYDEEMENYIAEQRKAGKTDEEILQLVKEKYPEKFEAHYAEEKECIKFQNKIVNALGKTFGYGFLLEDSNILMDYYVLSKYDEIKEKQGEAKADEWLDMMLQSNHDLLGENWKISYNNQDGSAWAEMEEGDQIEELIDFVVKNIFFSSVEINDNIRKQIYNKIINGDDQLKVGEKVSLSDIITIFQQEYYKKYGTGETLREADIKAFLYLNLSNYLGLKDNKYINDNFNVHTENKDYDILSWALRMKLMKMD